MNAGEFVQAVIRESERAEAKHPKFPTLHHSYAVLLEEVDEFKAEVWKQSDARDNAAMRKELIQIAAMCLRTVEDLNL